MITNKTLKLSLKSLREFRVQPLEFGIDREQAMLSEANRADVTARALREFKILLRRDVGVGREPGMDV